MQSYVDKVIYIDVSSLLLDHNHHRLEKQQLSLCLPWYLVQNLAQYKFKQGTKTHF